VIVSTPLARYEKSDRATLLRSQPLPFCPCLRYTAAQRPKEVPMSWKPIWWRNAAPYSASPVATRSGPTLSWPHMWAAGTSWVNKWLARLKLATSPDLALFQSRSHCAAKPQVDCTGGA